MYEVVNEFHSKTTDENPLRFDVALHLQIGHFLRSRLTSSCSGLISPIGRESACCRSDFASRIHLRSVFSWSIQVAGSLRDGP